MPKQKKLCDVSAAAEHCWQVYCRQKFSFLLLCGLTNHQLCLGVTAAVVVVEFAVFILSASGNNCGGKSY